MAAEAAHVILVAVGREKGVASGVLPQTGAGKDALRNRIPVVLYLPTRHKYDGEATESRSQYHNVCVCPLVLTGAMCRRRFD